MAEPKKIELVGKVHTILKAVEGFILIDLGKDGNMNCSLSKEFGYSKEDSIKVIIKPIEKDKADAKKAR